jgi:SH3 domain protein
MLSGLVIRSGYTGTVGGCRRAALVMVLGLLALSVPAPAARAEARQQYISDEISAPLRQRPANDAEEVGMVKSGAQVTVLESLGAGSFAHIHTSDGRDGWVATRFLSSQPAARDLLVQQKQQLDQAHAQLQSLQRDLQTAQQQLDQARPALALAGENEKLRAGIVQREQQVGALEQRFDVEEAHQRTLVTGAILVACGVLVGLMLPWLGQRKRRRYGDL